MSGLRRSIGGFDALMVNVGSIIGSGGFMAATPVAPPIASVPPDLVVWAVAALVPLAGAPAIAGLCAPAPAALAAVPHRTTVAAFGAALMQPLWAFDGWADAACLGGEIRRPGRNLPLATVGSVLLVAVLYLALNAGYLRVLGPGGV